MKHLIFFDAQCFLCTQAVHWVIQNDPEKLFSFTPLDGKTASELSRTFGDLKKENSLVLLENYGTPNHKLWLRGRGVCRIFWLLGGLYRLVGWLCFVPFGIDLLYRFIARHRRIISAKDEGFSIEEKKRFLP